MIKTLSTLVGLVLAAALPLFGSAAPAAADGVEDAKAAIGAGDGATGARLIRENGYYTQPQVLADMIYVAGVIAVRSGKGDSFSKAVAQSFVEGKVSHSTANTTFVHAVAVVLTNAPHDDQLLAELGPGGAAILRTELAYLNIYLPSLPYL